MLIQKKIFIETYGCQMNEYDSELVRAILTKAEYAFTQDEAKADIIMLNTCAIREHAHRKVYGRVHKILHDRGAQPVKIGILGCMATNLRTELFEDRGLKIDFIAGPDSYKRLPQLIDESYRTGNKQFDLTLSEFETYSDVFAMRDNATGDGHDRSVPDTPHNPNAWIAVMRGCNNFCTFCVVPYTRGRERSRSVANIVEEAERLAADGFKQITLLGQNVNSYRHEEDDFADLMAAVARVKGIERIRFTSPHPKDFPDKFLEVMAAHDNICKQIHLPLQAGSDRILELMNRTYTQEEFLKLVDNIRAKVPGIALSTDVIVGFCTETDAEFDETLKVMRQVEFDSAFMFKYSQRKGTIASRKMEDDVPEAIKTERIVALNELQREIGEKRNLAHIGQELDVMIEKAGTRKDDHLYLGRADNNKLVTVPEGDYRIGDMIRVRVVGASPFNLRGELAQ